MLEGVSALRRTGMFALQNTLSQQLLENMDGDPERFKLELVQDLREQVQAAVEAQMADGRSYQQHQFSSTSKGALGWVVLDEGTLLLLTDARAAEVGEWVAWEALPAAEGGRDRARLYDRCFEWDEVSPALGKRVRFWERVS